MGRCTRAFPRSRAPAQCFPGTALTTGLWDIQLIKGLTRNIIISDPSCAACLLRPMHEAGMAGQHAAGTADLPAAAPPGLVRSAVHHYGQHTGKQCNSTSQERTSRLSGAGRCTGSRTLGTGTTACSTARPRGATTARATPSMQSTSTVPALGYAKITCFCVMYLAALQLTDCREPF